MEIAKLDIQNFRGIKEANILINGHTVLVGDNNTGKSTILEAIDLVLGPERLSKSPIINEHDFYAGEYIGIDGSILKIEIEIIVTGLNDEQLRHFRNNIEWWSQNDNKLIDSPPAEIIDDPKVIEALRLKFEGFYDPDEDDFFGKTFFCSPPNEDESLSVFSKKDKRVCGFLFLRTLRTGTRALSLEKGTLLDIILRLRELRPQMWEDILTQLKDVTVASDPEIGISDILTSVQKSIKELIPSEWGSDPKLQVSNLTRDHLRKILTVFMTTGAHKNTGQAHFSPYFYQGTGTINMLVLTLLSMIAELKQNVIFAMEEPEIAIPPYTQKRIINSIIEKSSQAIFTSHSPFVLEQFTPENILVLNRSEAGTLRGMPATYPPSIKPKAYKEEMKRRYCEALLARKVLITEGRSEYDAYPACARRLSDLNSIAYKPIETLGIAVLNAESESNIAPIGKYFSDLGKTVFAVFDKQEAAKLAEIEEHVHFPYEAREKGFEKIITEGVKPEFLKSYALKLVEENEWPPSLNHIKPETDDELSKIKDSMFEYLRSKKGEGAAADLLVNCLEEECPEFLRNTLSSIKSEVEPDIPEERKSEEDPI